MLYLKVATLLNTCKLVFILLIEGILCRYWPELTDREHDEDDGTDPPVIHGEVLQRSPLTAPRLPRHNQSKTHYVPLLNMMNIHERSKY